MTDLKICEIVQLFYCFLQCSAIFTRLSLSNFDPTIYILLYYLTFRTFVFWEGILIISRTPCFSPKIFSTLHLSSFRGRWIHAVVTFCTSSWTLHFLQLTSQCLVLIRTRSFFVRSLIVLLKRTKSFWCSFILRVQLEKELSISVLEKYSSSRPHSISLYRSALQYCTPSSSAGSAGSIAVVSICTSSWTLQFRQLNVTKSKFD